MSSGGDGVAHLTVYELENNQRSDELQIVKCIIPLLPNMINTSMGCHFAKDGM